MLKAMLRIMLVGSMLMGFCQLHAPTVAHAGGGSATWASTPPVLDGIASASEWGAAQLLTYTNFSVRYENDDQFLYLLIDVTAETSNNPLTHDDDASFLPDPNQDGTSEYIFAPAFSGAPYPMKRSDWTSGVSYTGMLPSTSYSAVGFGPSLASSTPHRIYEMAVRLSEMQALPGHAIFAKFYAGSTTPSFTELTTAATIGMVSPQVAFIYNTPAGMTDATTFQTKIYNQNGVWATLVSMGQVASIDFSPYRAIVVGNDTATAQGVTYLDAASIQKIRLSGKPVVGIGHGGEGIFAALGSYLTFGNSWQEIVGGTAILPYALENPAWNTPGTVSTVGNVNLYSVPVAFDAVSLVETDFPGFSMTVLSGQVSHLDHSPILSQAVNGTCYTLWGFTSSPASLTADGVKLFSNLVWQPACVPAVVYIGASDLGLRNTMNNLLSTAGYPHQLINVSSVTGFDFSPYQHIIIGWDTATTWTPANASAVKASRLPVLAMGDGGFQLYFWRFLPVSIGLTTLLTPQTQAALINPIQPMLRSPNPVALDSELTALLDGGAGGQEVYPMWSALPASTNLIGSVQGQASHYSFFTQSYAGVCFSFWGLEGYPNTMTPLAKNLFRNMLASPRCSYSLNLPQIQN